ncbi:MAG: hypothetical protein ACTSQI_14000 [Candidatus Helarchaeota archaeon]
MTIDKVDYFKSIFNKELGFYEVEIINFIYFIDENLTNQNIDVFEELDYFEAFCCYFLLLQEINSIYLNEFKESCQNSQFEEHCKGLLIKLQYLIIDFMDLVDSEQLFEEYFSLKILNEIWEEEFNFKYESEQMSKLENSISKITLSIEYLSNSIEEIYKSLNEEFDTKLKFYLEIENKIFWINTNRFLNSSLKSTVKNDFRKILSSFKSFRDVRLPENFMSIHKKIKEEFITRPLIKLCYKNKFKYRNMDEKNNLDEFSLRDEIKRIFDANKVKYSDSNARILIDFIFSSRTIYNLSKHNVFAFSPFTFYSVYQQSFLQLIFFYKVVQLLRQYSENQ